MKNRMPLSQALSIARRFMMEIALHCNKAIVVGSTRRLKVDVGDIEVVCLPLEDDPLSLDKHFHKDYPGIKINGSRLKRFYYPKSQVQIELYITNPADYGRIVAIRTGSSAYSHYVLATTWNRKGWCGTKDGLRRKKECDHKKKTWQINKEFKEHPTKPPPFDTEEEFFKFLGLDWIEPSRRSWVSKNQSLNYSS